MKKMNKTNKKTEKWLNKKDHSLNNNKDNNNEITVLIILFSVAFLVRMLTYNSIFIGNDIRFLEFDTYYHMRRAIGFANIFPHIWNFDTYIDYPYGSIIGWPPLYDWTIALISYIIGLGNPSKNLIETVGVYFPVFLGSLSVVIIYYVAKEIFDAKIGIISSFLLAIIPAFVQVSFLGFVDHHVAEVLLSMTAYLFLLKSLKEKNFEKNFKNKNKLIFSFILISVLILAIFTWAGTPIFIGIILIYLTIQNMIDKNYRNLFIIVGIISISFIGIYFIFPETYNNLRVGIGYLAREGVLLQQVEEAKPLFFDGKITLEPAWYAFNTAFYIAMVGLILFITNLIRNFRKNNKEKVMFLVWTIIVLILNLYQTRFIYLFAVNIVILCSYLITKLINSNKSYIKAVGIILLISIFIPSIYTVNMMSKYPLMFSEDWFDSLKWLKDNTPEPYKEYENSFYFPSKDKIPDYGIMSWWNYGNYILYLSQRPVVANNFQLGVEDAAKFFTSENESEANAILNKRKVRYIIIDYISGLNMFRSKNKIYISGSWSSISSMSGKTLDYYLDKNRLPNERYLNTVYAKLYLFDGKELKDYKLIYKSRTKYPDIFNRPIEEIKIFEYTG